MKTATGIKSSISDLTGSDIAEQLAVVIKRFAKFGLVAIIFVFCLFHFSEYPGSTSILLIGMGALFPCYFWVKRKTRGLPVVLLLAAQCFFTYGTPLLVQSEDIWNSYSDAEVFRSAVEIVIYFVSLTLGWSLAISRIRRRPTHFYGFSFLQGKVDGKLLQICLALVFAAFAYQIASNQGWMDMVLRILPSASNSLLRTLMDAAGFVGGMLGGFLIGSGQMKSASRFLFWICIAGIITISISGFLLSSMTGLVIATLFGIFLGRGSFPVLAFAAFASVFAFFNLSKFEMRDKYWEVDQSYVSFPLSRLPAIYSEWIAASWDVVDRDSSSGSLIRQDEESEQSLLNRVNNLQNLLYVELAVHEGGYSLLNGKTYTLIPKLLIPRVFWPGKPRTHEGQVLLNTHFGRQTREASHTTYIAWGLLPEAYGNFGSIFGAVFIGCMLGLVAGLLEGWSRFYPLLSFQMLLILSVTLKLGVSFEMVASVFITSTFQQLVVIVMGLFFFLQRKRMWSIP